MSLRKRVRVLAAGKSPSTEMLKRTFNRAVLNGGVTVDFSANVENIREISRKLNTNIIKTPIQRNLIKFSEEFDNAIYVKSTATITANAIIAPNGTQTADKLIGSVGNVPHYINQACLQIGIKSTVSIYAKKGEKNNVIIHVGDTEFSFFDIQNGIVGQITSGIVSSIQDAGNGWWRCIATAIPTTTTMTVIAAEVNSFSNAFPGNGVDGIYIWGAQVEQNSFATNYQYTQNAPMDGDFTNANFLYVPASYGEGKNFAEVQNKRNLLIFTEEFDNAIWLKNNITLTANQATAPNGTLTADKLTETASNVNHFISSNSFVPLPIGVYTYSCYVKANGRQWVILNLPTPTDAAGWFDIINGVTGTSIGGITTSIQNAGNGWFRCILTRLTNSTTASASVNPTTGNGVNSTFLGDGVSGYYIWGAQLETGVYATPYQKQVSAGDGIVDFNFTRATAATVTNKLGVIEDSCYNLHQYSGDYTNAIWSKNNTTIVVFSGIYGVEYAVKDTAINNNHLVLQVVPLKTGTTYTTTYRIRKGAHSWVQVILGGTSFNTNIWFNFNFDTGLVGNMGSATTSANYNIQNLGNGYYDLSIIAAAISNTSDAVGVLTGTNNTNTATRALTYVGNASDTIVNIVFSQLIQGSTSRPYLRTTNRLNVPRLDYSNNQVRRNLLNYSENFSNAAWLKGSPYFGNIISNVSTAPDRTMTAQKLVADTSNNYHAIAQLVPNITGVYTASIYVKKAELTFATLQITDHVASSTNCNCNLSTGVVNITTGGSVFTGTTVTTQSVGDDWYLITLTTNKTTASSNIWYQLYATNAGNTVFTGDGNSGVYVWGAKLEQGSTATPYQYTTDISTLNKEPSLLIEKASTNLTIQSQDYSQAAWVKTNTTASLSGSVGVTGIQSYNVTETIGSGTHFLFNNQNTAITAGQTYTTTVFLKKKSVTWIQLSPHSDSFGGNAFISFNFDTGTFGGAGSAITSKSVQSLPNGWFKISYTSTAIAVGTAVSFVLAGTNNTNNFSAYMSYVGNASTILCEIAGVQFEVGSTATTYIPTTTVAVTRNAETNYVDLFNNSALNRTNWTLFWEGYLYDGNATTPSLCLSDSTTAATNTNQIGWTHVIQPFHNIAGARVNQYTGTTVNTFNRFAVQYNNGIANFYLNGVNIFPNRSVPVFDYRYLVLNSGGSSFTTDKIALFNRTLTVAECVTLTDNPGITTTPFISTWNTNNTSSGSSASNQIKLPLPVSGVYAMNVDWGDGTTNYISAYNQPEVTHTYTVAGAYTITIKGICVGWQFSGTGDRGKILTVVQWGCLRLTDVGSYFNGCSNLNLSAVSDVLNTSGLTSYNNFFNGALSNGFVNRIGEWDTSSVTNLVSFSQNSIFNSAIGGWDVRNVTAFSYMFNGNTQFNNGGSPDINNWKFKPGVNMQNMFYYAQSFNQPIGNWDVSQVVSMSFMFYWNLNFDQDLSSWNVGNVTNMSGMFLACRKFNNLGNPNINNWNTSNVTSMSEMFGTGGTGAGTYIFNQPIGNWNTAKVTTMYGMFGTNSTQSTYSFNQPIGTWNTSNVTDMTLMFCNAHQAFNQNLNAWNVTKVTSFLHMFNSGGNVFNNGLATGVSGPMPWIINTTSAVNMGNMFTGCNRFNQDISTWDTSQVVNMSAMFENASVFNQNLNTWNVSKVTNFGSNNVNNHGMFQNAIAFNNGLASGVSGTMTWNINISAAVTMLNMFQGTSSFNQDISSWNMSKVTDMTQFLSGANKFNQNISNLDFSNCVTFNTAFQGTTIFNNGLASGVSGTMPWIINTTSSSVLMNNMFQNCLAFNQDISSWNTSKVTNISAMFQGANKFNQPIGVWNTSSLVQVLGTFNSASIFNQNLSSWDMSKVVNIGQMFFNATAFNNGLSSGVSGTLPWNFTVLANGFNNLFQGCINFNQDISNWNVGSVTNFGSAFSGCVLFNQPLSSWNVSSATTLDFMFNNTPAFNQDIGAWNPALNTNLTNFMSGKTAANFSAANLDSIYNNWTNKLLKPSLSPTFGTAKYTVAASSSRALLTRANATKPITNAINNGSGLIRLTVVGHGMSTGNKIFIFGVTGTIEANGGFNVTTIDASTLDLQGSTFTNAYISGGVIQTGYGWAITDGGI